jgi:hypothetical protein
MWLEEGQFPPNIIDTNIALVAKAARPESMKDFRPMGLTYVEAANPSVTSYLPMIAFYSARLLYQKSLLSSIFLILTKLLVVKQ